MNSPDAKNLHILLAEDDKDDQQFITLAFEELAVQHSLHITDNGQQLLDRLEHLEREQNLPCLIVLDLNMPIMDGAQTLEALREKPAFHGIPKIIFTTSSSEADKEKCLSRGAADYIVKPAGINEFVGSVAQMLQHCD
jgi:CheY-like chemotaxis protein